jgi:hypothetical protein
VDGAYDSVLVVVPEKIHPPGLQSSVSPPAIKTFPSGSNVAVWFDRRLVMVPVAANVPVLAS